MKIGRSIRSCLFIVQCSAELTLLLLGVFAEIMKFEQCCSFVVSKI